MRWFRPGEPEVVRGGDETDPKMALPDAIHRQAREEWVPGGSDPVRERRAAAGGFGGITWIRFRMRCSRCVGLSGTEPPYVGCYAKRVYCAAENGRDAGRYLATGAAIVSSNEHVVRRGAGVTSVATAIRGNGFGFSDSFFCRASFRLV
jgi:hypothetical protein